MIWVPIDHYVDGKAVHGNLAFVFDMNRQMAQNRPGYGGGWFLRNGPHNWLEERNVDYQLVWCTIKHDWWHVGIEDPDIAMLFKLTWL